MPPLLVVDDEEDIRELVAMAVEAEFDDDVIEVSSGNEAIALLESGQRFDLIVSDYNMQEGTGGDLFRYVSEKKLGIPFVLCSSDHPNDHNEFSNKKLAGFVQKPNVVIPAMQLFKSIRGQLGRIREDESYVRVRVISLTRYHQLRSDIFLKLSDGKFAPFKKKGERFTEEEVNSFIKKDIYHVYLRREDAAFFIDGLERSLTALSNAQKIELTLSFEASKDVLDLIKDMSQSLGWSPEIQKLTQENTTLALKTFQQNPDLLQVLDKAVLNANSYVSSHSSVLSYVACGIAHSAGLDSDQNLYQLALAALLHDFALDEMDQATAEERRQMVRSQQNLDSKEIQTYLNHPKESASLVDRFPEIPADIESIILQHHERPDGGGFPAALDHSFISELAAVFIIAEEFVDYLFDCQTKKKKPSFANFSEGHGPYFREGKFKKIFDSFERSTSH